ncbi:MAG: hypothetical protein EXS36_04290 [Pedosphaera sp.]|nr:hypothetical protein [Pedosphaera sp.]
MNSKVLSFVAGVVVGVLIAAAGFLAGSKTGRGPTTAEILETASSETSHVAELESSLQLARKTTATLESQNTKLAAQVQSLLRKSSTPVIPRPAIAAPELDAADNESFNAIATAFTGGTNGPMSKAMKEMKQQAMRIHMEGKMNQMKQRLNLTPSQETSVRGLLEKQMGMGKEAAEKALAGNVSTDDLEKMSKAGGNPEEEIKALLSPEQQQGYSAMKEEEKGSMARLMANSELIQMQTLLGLTQDQQDKVFGVLIQSQQQILNPESPNKTPDFRGQLEESVKSLQGVLTEDQIAGYRKFKESQIKLMESFLPKTGSGAGGIPTVIPIPAAPAP